MSEKGTTIVSALGNGNIENWGDSGGGGVMADNSQQTDTSTDIDTDDKNQVLFFVSFSVFSFILKIISCSSISLCFTCALILKTYYCRYLITLWLN